ncbi:uncharacterized protein LOC135161273 [Diachasmimorpha longicaudata]|uniref:uncharacterized protein LOC135161273 n=1 Tax=Diachasmimorpha longicaudata TaxID=58733 RepID=UPI0030B8D737
MYPPDTSRNISLNKERERGESRLLGESRGLGREITSQRLIFNAATAFSLPGGASGRHQRCPPDGKIHWLCYTSSTEGVVKHLVDFPFVPQTHRLMTFNNTSCRNFQ